MRSESLVRMTGKESADIEERSGKVNVKNNKRMETQLKSSIQRVQPSQLESLK